MLIDEQLVGSAELKHLAESLAPPCQLGEYMLEGLISRTATALIFVVRGGAFGPEREGVLKLTGKAYAPLLERELSLLNRCHEAGVSGVIRPVRAELEWIELDDDDPVSVVALLLPFLSGGDLVHWIGTHAAGPERLGPAVALNVGGQVGATLQTLLRLPQPIVYGDVKPQNVLLPKPGAIVDDLTLIDLDASHELDTRPQDLITASREVRQHLVDDVNGFGELLYNLATGHEPPAEGEPNPNTRNSVFDALVVLCLTSEVSGRGYASLADPALWRDLEKARAAERTRKHFDLLMRRAPLIALAIVLFCLLALAIVAKFFNW